MKTALIVLWTLAAGILLFLIVRKRITQALRDIARDAGDPPRGSGDPPRGSPEDRGPAP
ncbi:hypothetical protein [Methylobacterium oryzisoli]|uniref:hypothetical protein n=1 Tax=Methylobacterium oryzisoli TaxID=3385502 RepID=UPI003892198F